MKFETKISGIPCVCEVHTFIPAKASHRSMAWEDCYEEDAKGLFEYSILDRKGYKARWLEEKITDDDHDRLAGEYWAWLV